ncbi:TetR/AcrR family transcriptional regulator [Sphingobium yanoikuyae]|uniref:TetR/AcrR family transcriptional regulator n=1 Tax=Sphingobium yanoikuyae TaxID=13690 RepID=UPI0012372DF7|nr:TetR/AcrR family transcriptional regulator [Sphingobium yanoikuyae]
MASTDRSETTRRALCLAAEALVATDGIGTATLRRVAVAAGQRNTAAVSYHFGNLEELLRAVVDMRLRDTEKDRCAIIHDMGVPLADFSAFDVWRCLTKPYFMLTDEQAQHAHIRFLMHMSVAGLLGDPFEAGPDRPGAPSINCLLDQLHDVQGSLPPMIGRARISLSGMMVWNAVALYDNRALGGEQPDLGLDALLADVEGLVRQILE